MLRIIMICRSLLKKPYLFVRRSVLFLPGLLNRYKTVRHETIKKILLLRHDRVGDMVLSTPVFRALKTAYPDASVTVLASERNHDVLRNSPYVDEVLMYRGIRDFMRETRTRKFDMAIDLFLTHHMKQAFMTFLSGAPYRVGFRDSGREIFFTLKGPAALPQKRMLEHLSDLAQAAGADAADSEPEVFLSEQEMAWAESEAARLGLKEAWIVAVHPGAYYPSQRWSAEKFGQSARQVIETYGTPVFIFGSENERPLLENIQSIAGDRSYIFCGLTLRQFMALLNRCRLLLCNNSGPLHIASALRIPTISMTGPTVVPLWLPRGKNHVCINKGLPCSPCNNAVCADHSCMNLLTVNEVMDACASQVQRIAAEQYPFTPVFTPSKEGQNNAGENKQLPAYHK